MSWTIPYLDGIGCCRWCSSRKETNMVANQQFGENTSFNTLQSPYSTSQIVFLTACSRWLAFNTFTNVQIQLSLPETNDKMAVQHLCNVWVCIRHTTFTRNFWMFTETNVHKKHRSAKPGTFIVVSLPRNDKGENLSTHKPIFRWRMTSSLGDKKRHYLGHPIFHWTMIYGS